jgi:hypothetical protein
MTWDGLVKKMLLPKASLWDLKAGKLSTHKNNPDLGVGVLSFPLAKPS